MSRAQLLAGGLWLIVNLMLMNHSQAQVIASIPDTTEKKNTTILIPVRVNLKNYDVIAYSFEVNFNPDILFAKGVSSQGTLTESWVEPFINLNFKGKIIVGAYGIGDTINQKGILVNLVFDVIGSEGKNTPIELSDFVFNNGYPRVYKDSGIFTVKLPSALNSNDENNRPKDIKLYHNYPDPFITTTTISYGLSNKQHVTIKILNILGQEIRTLMNSDHLPGNYLLQWDGCDNFGVSVSNGIYFCIMKTETYSEVEKIIITK